MNCIPVADCVEVWDELLPPVRFRQVRVGDLPGHGPQVLVCVNAAAHLGRGF